MVGEELVVELVLVITDVQQEGTARPQQPGVVPGVDQNQLSHGPFHTPAQQAQPQTEVVGLHVS